MRIRWLVNTIRIVIFACIVGAALWLIYGQNWYDRYINKDKPVADHAPITLSTWVVDWDWDASTVDIQALFEEWESVQLFLGYFDEHDQVIWNDELKSKIIDARNHLSTEDKQSETPIYLTVVNDIVKASGSSLQKDRSLVERIIATPESQYTYIEQFASLVRDNDFDGLEIDFENIADEHWQELLEFYKMLYRRLAAENIPLRIVLEPKVNFKDLELPEGPQYVVMAYNLFGYHSGPGPKADRSFINQLTAKMENIPGHPIVAIATGGFDWEGTERPNALSEQEAKELEAQADSGTVSRDKDSGAVTFTYQDEQGQSHTVWYADAQTLSHWIEMIQQRGYSDIAVWRMGNISDESLMVLRNVVNESNRSSKLLK